MYVWQHGIVVKDGIANLLDSQIFFVGVRMCNGDNYAGSFFVSSLMQLAHFPVWMDFQIEPHNVWNFSPPSHLLNWRKHGFGSKSSNSLFCPWSCGWQAVGWQMDHMGGKGRGDLFGWGSIPRECMPLSFTIKRAWGSDNCSLCEFLDSTKLWASSIYSQLLSMSLQDLRLTLSEIYLSWFYEERCVHVWER